MASPASLNRSVPFPRVTTFKEIGDVQKWAQQLLRALELQFGMGGGGLGGGSGEVATGRASPAGITQGVNIVQPTAYPYTPTFSDLIVLVDTSSARVINLPGASLGFSVTIKDGTGTASGNHITINASAGQFIQGGASYTISTNFAAATLLGTGIAGAEWVIF